MALETTRWDVADYLDSPARIAGYLEAAFEDGDPALIAAAIGDVARAKGMAAVAKEARLSRESLYRALKAGSRPEFATLNKVLRAVGLRLSVEPIEKAPPRRRRRAVAAPKGA